MSQICHAHNCRAVQKNETHPGNNWPLHNPLFCAMLEAWIQLPLSHRLLPQVSAQGVGERG